MIKEKQYIRKKIAALKKGITGEVSADLSKKIWNRLIQTDVFQKGKSIALYYAMDDEVQTSGLIEEWYKKKKIVLPVVTGEDINFYAYAGKENMTKGALGISEPISSALISPENIDLFIVPGVAFDREGNRLGRGKGYYDRFLSVIDKPTIGLCYDFQLLDQIPAEPHDKKMTMIITETTLIISNALIR